MRCKNCYVKRILTYLALFLLPIAITAQKVVSITIDATINPATAEFIHRALGKAQKEKAELKKAVTFFLSYLIFLFTMETYAIDFFFIIHGGFIFNYPSPFN